jgi:hypothetical protein
MRRRPLISTISTTTFRSDRRLRHPSKPSQCEGFFVESPARRTIAATFFGFEFSAILNG